MTLATWVTAGIATLSLAVSGLAVYFTQLRGASISLHLLSPPDAWSIQLMTAIGGGQLSIQQPVSHATHCEVSGSANVLVSNDGPKGGAVWAARVAVTNLPAGCTVVQPPVASEVMTLAGNSSETFSLPFTFRWPIEDSLAVFSALAMQPETIALVLSYHHHGFLGKGKRASSGVSVARADMWCALLDHVHSSYFDIGQVAARPELDRMFNGAFPEVRISHEERLALWQGLWMAIQQPQYPLDYPVDDVTGSMRLLFRTGDAANAVYSDGSPAVLDMIAQEHRKLVTAATDVLVKVRQSLGLPG